MAAKLFGLDGSTVRRIQKLFALDGSTPRRVKKLFSNDGGSIRLIFEDFSTFTVSGTSNPIVSPVNEVVDFGVRSDFDAGGADVNVNTSGTGDASNVGVTGITIDVDSSHTYAGSSPLRSPGGAPRVQGPSPGFSQPPVNAVYFPSDPQLGMNSPTGPVTQFRTVLGGFPMGNFTSGSYITINGVQTTSYSVYQNPGIRQFQFGNGVYLQSYNGYGVRLEAPASGVTIGNIRVAGAPTVTTTGRRARVQNGTSKSFTISSGGLTAGNSFATGALSAGASTGYITANSTSEAWTLVGVATKDPATFTITNADSSISVSGTFADGETASDARDRIQSVLNADSTFQGKFNTGVDSDKTIDGVAHKVVTFTSDTAENTSDFSITITANDGSNTTPYEATTTQGASESLQTTVQVTRAVEGSEVSSTKAISSSADTDTAGAEVATLGGDISYDSGTNKLKVQDMDATVNVSNAGSLSFSKD
jgi:hypothetical protein